jgi:ribonuclease VapC
MFVDASAAIAIIAGETDGAALAAELDRAETVFLSPISYWETVLGLTRAKVVGVAEAREIVDAFMAETRAVMLDITRDVGGLAIEASARFGKGRHPAALNMGDCFAYACAMSIGAPLLFKGNDFSQTDIEAP